VGQKTVRFSDLSGELISHDDAVARIVIRQHPELGDRPVEIEAHADEARVIEKAGLRLAVVDLYLPGEDGPRQVAMDADSFDKLATEKAMRDVLEAARPARRGSRADGSGASADRAAYASADHAGMPHRGRITEAEKRLVRERLDEINQRLAGQGLRTISLADREHVERYGLEDLARSRGVV
jgi:ATP-dependent Clp protease ATP-binding subunit ClpA